LRASTLVVFKNASDVEQMMLRLHSNIDDWGQRSAGDKHVSLIRASVRHRVEGW